MKPRVKYFIGYVIAAITIGPIASFIDFAFGLNILNMGVWQTLGFSLTLGILLGTVFGLILKLSPIHFPWSHW